MSLHTLVPNSEHIDMIIVGWDSAMSTFFGRVVPRDDAPADIPSLWLGQHAHEHPSPGPVLARLAPHTTATADELAELEQHLHLDSHPSHAR